jgi:hypothetical protein
LSVNEVSSVQIQSRQKDNGCSENFLKKDWIFVGRIEKITKAKEKLADEGEKNGGDPVAISNNNMCIPIADKEEGSIE